MTFPGPSTDLYEYHHDQKYCQLITWGYRRVGGCIGVNSHSSPGCFLHFINSYFGCFYVLDIHEQAAKIKNGYQHLFRERHKSSIPMVA